MFRHLYRLGESNAASPTSSLSPQRRSHLSLLSFNLEPLTDTLQARGLYCSTLTSSAFHPILTIDLKYSFSGAELEGQRVPRPPEAAGGQEVRAAQEAGLVQQPAGR